MGFMDKVKDSVKNADEKLGNAIDKEKIDSEIRKQEKAIEDFTKKIGDKVLEALPRPTSRESTRTSRSARRRSPS